MKILPNISLNLDLKYRKENSMIANSCPFGRPYCDGCNFLTTGGCITKQNISHTFSITHDDMIAIWDRRKEELRKEELMKLSKEELVEIIIGKREHVSKTFG